MNLFFSCFNDLYFQFHIIIFDRFLAIHTHVHCGYMCAVHNTLGGHNRLLGDFLCIAGAFAQSLSLVGEEFIIKGELIIIEYMAMLGFGGAIAASIQLLVAIT